RRERSAAIRCDLGPASNAGRAQNRIDPKGESALGGPAALLTRHRSQWAFSSLAPCQPTQSTLARGAGVLQQSPNEWKISRSNGCASTGRVPPLSSAPGLTR